EIETDKATMELEAYEEGTLLHIGVQEKETVPINSILAIVGKPGEDITALLAEAKHPVQAATAEQVATATTATTSNLASTPTQPTEIPTQANNTLQRTFASPLAKKIAQDKGYDLATINGTGEGGRIVKRDVEHLAAKTQPSASLPSATLPPVIAEEAYEEVPVSQMRKTIAKRLSASKLSAPDFYLTVQVDMDKVAASRPSINQYAPVKVSFNDIIMKAAAAAIRQHPSINVAWLGDTMRYNKHIHIGIAMAVEAGLLVPVIRFADHKSLVHLAAEIQELSHKAHNNQLQPQDLTGSTFNISNLGMLGIESFTAIINPPSACILAIGEIKQVPVVKESAVVPGYVMKATLSCDHRAVDGAVGAAFLKTFKALLEDPLRLLAY
ncbi:MAG: dihydrolipoamide acetyltransferase family protein, partial [Bacteroidota bacterium]